MFSDYTEEAMLYLAVYPYCNAWRWVVVSSLTPEYSGATIQGVMVTGGAFVCFGSSVDHQYEIRNKIRQRTRAERRMDTWW